MRGCVRAAAVALLGVPTAVAAVGIAKDRGGDGVPHSVRVIASRVSATRVHVCVQHECVCVQHVYVRVRMIASRVRVRVQRKCERVPHMCERVQHVCVQC